MNIYFEKLRDSDISTACFKCDNNNCYPHFHSNIEIVYVLSGNIKITINGNSKLLQSGDVSISNAYDIHSYTTMESSEIILLIIPINFVNSYTNIIHSKTLKENYLLKSIHTEEIWSSLKSILNSKDLNGLEVKGHLYVILGILIRQLGLEKRSKTNSNIFNRDILVFLEQNYLEDITLGDIAKKFGYNKDYLSKLFNSYIGCSFTRYINILRARYAAQLIKTSSDDLTRIAFLSGFGSYRTFTRAFNSTFKKTPSEYREQLNHTVL